MIDGRTLFFQGTLLADFDPERMIEALRVPVEKLARRDLDDARQRVVTLREALGGVPPVAEIQAALLEGFREHLDIEPYAGKVTDYEERLARRLHDESIGTEEFVRSLDAPADEAQLVSATLVRRGGSLRADLRLEGPGRSRVREALVTGDFFLSPPRARLDLEASLRGVAAADAGAAVEAFFARAPCELIGLGVGLPRSHRERSGADHADGRRSRTAGSLAWKSKKRLDARLPARRARQHAAVARLPRPARALHRVRGAAL